MKSHDEEILSSILAATISIFTDAEMQHFTSDGCIQYFYTVSVYVHYFHNLAFNLICLTVLFAMDHDYVFTLLHDCNLLRDTLMRTLPTVN